MFQLLALAVNLLPSINAKNAPGKQGMYTRKTFREEMKQTRQDAQTQVAAARWVVTKEDCYVLFGTIPFFLWPGEQPFARKRDLDNYWKALLDELVKARALWDDSLVVGYWSALRFEYDPRKLLAELCLYRFSQQEYERQPPMQALFDDWAKRQYNQTSTTDRKEGNGTD